MNDVMLVFLFKLMGLLRACKGTWDSTIAVPETVTAKALAAVLGTVPDSTQERTWDNTWDNP